MLRMSTFWNSTRYIQKDFSLTTDKEQMQILFRQYRISKREQEIVHLILAGKSNTEITKTLFISLHTVKNHIYNIYQKMGINNRYQLLYLFSQNRGDLT